MLVTFPEVVAFTERGELGRIWQVAHLGYSANCTASQFSANRRSGVLLTEPDGQQTVIASSELITRYGRVLRGEPPAIGDTSADLSGASWAKHPSIVAADPSARIAMTLESWRNSFHYIQEDLPSGAKGLRSAQLGALHALLAHWSISNSLATIVLPTGTGKTETMLAITVLSRSKRVLVIVPTDALRRQVARKFATLGKLKEAGSTILSSAARTPVVATLDHIPQTPQSVMSFMERAQVIITTSSIAGRASAAVQREMAQHCEHLFIDEAHHAEAATWQAVRERFSECKIVQFTATPFREDGQSLDGTIAYRYPLRRARADGYFQSIRFDPVVEFDPIVGDQQIARKAIARLRVEHAMGHVLFARADSIARAQEIWPLYSGAEEFGPVLLHSGLPKAERDRAREQIIRGSSRIVVCVDMLGEGFDLPQLKIAALHDVRKSLGPTLQLAGRFARTLPGLGQATFIANTADVRVQDELRRLYSEDPDWNELLPELGDHATNEQLSLQEFLAGFSNTEPDIPLKSITPAMSTVIYRTSARIWHPENFRDGIPNIRNCPYVFHSINVAKNTLVVITSRHSGLKWTDLASLYESDWELYVVIWSPAQQLIFINSSTNAGEFRSLAAAVAGSSDIRLLEGQSVFRVFSGITRLQLQSVGLSEQFGRNLRYTARMGGDVGGTITQPQRAHTTRAVISGTGFENGSKTTVGASRKGRLWSFRRERLDGLQRWCISVGAKVVDASIDSSLVLAGTLEVKVVTVRPASFPVAVDWPDLVYLRTEASVRVRIDRSEFFLHDCSIDLVAPSVDGPLMVSLKSDSAQASLGLEFFSDAGVESFRFNPHGGSASVRVGDSEWVSASEFLTDNPPVIWFADGSALRGNDLVELPSSPPRFERSSIDARSWAGCDLRVEAQGPERDSRSIQWRMIQDLIMTDKYEIIFDDDAAGEIADIVAIYRTDATGPLVVEFFHCKYAGGGVVGARVGDLYEVCGQAQKSISWLASSDRKEEIFTHLMRREDARVRKGGQSRLQLGSLNDLLRLRNMSRDRHVKFRISIVQPGLSKVRCSDEQLALLGVTESYLMETYQVPSE